MGTLEALKLKTNGGWVPAGTQRKTVCEMATIRQLAVSRLADGCKYTLMTAVPLIVVRLDVLDVVHHRGQPGARRPM